MASKWVNCCLRAAHVATMDTNGGFPWCVQITLLGCFLWYWGCCYWSSSIFLVSHYFLFPISFPFLCLRPCCLCQLISLLIFSSCWIVFVSLVVIGSSYSFRLSNVHYNSWEGKKCTFCGWDMHICVEIWPAFLPVLAGTYGWRTFFKIFLVPSCNSF